MEVRKIENNKRQFLDLLLLADEQEDMIDKYLDRGDLFALYDGNLRTRHGDGGIVLNVRYIDRMW